MDAKHILKELIQSVNEIDKAIEAVHEKPEENDRPNIEGMLGLLG